jgi:transposase
MPHWECVARGDNLKKHFLVSQESLFEPIPADKLELIPREDLIKLFRLEQDLRLQLQKDNKRLRALNDELEQKSFYIDEQLVTLKNKYFGKSSEKEPSDDQKKVVGTPHKTRGKKKKVQLPSLRYPNAPLIERDVELKDLPGCKCCGEKMSDSGMTETAEFLTVIPKQYIVIRQKRHKYRCGKCHGDIVTAPAPPRINPGSSYSDEMVVDVAMTKYCDLIPMERYSSMAGRAGLMDLPPQSLIEQSHRLADFVKGAYEKLPKEVCAARVLNADETPQRMLEGSSTSSWYLWGFSTNKTCYFECHDTRSGDVASRILLESHCEYLMSDVFSGYGKAVRVVNLERAKNNIAPIVQSHCNAHVRRKFKEAKEKFPDEAKFYIDIYKKIYRLEKIAKARPPDRILRVRRLMLPLFEEMKTQAMKDIAGYSSKSTIFKAMSYFLKNYAAFIRFLGDRDLPIDNNSQESLLRNPVIGRKTWYGTHSERGAKTAAVLFSLVESCRLNKINPREYFKNLVQDLHQGKKPYTPKDYADLKI